jgi:hypothetical protein
MAVQRLDAVNAANEGRIPALNPPPVVNTPIGKVIGSSSDPRFGNAGQYLSGLSPSIHSLDCSMPQYHEGFSKCPIRYMSGEGEILQL